MRPLTASQSGSTNTATCICALNRSSSYPTYHHRRARRKPGKLRLPIIFASQSAVCTKLAPSVARPANALEARARGAYRWRTDSPGCEPAPLPGLPRVQDAGPTNPVLSNRPRLLFSSRILRRSLVLRPSSLLGTSRWLLQRVPTPIISTPLPIHSDSQWGSSFRGLQPSVCWISARFVTDPTA